MTLPNIDVTEVVRSTAGKYIGGDVSGLSKEELVAKVKTLATKDPAKADQMIGEVGDKIDSQTGGKFAGRTDQIQEMVKSQLGI
jgi:MT0933-like antitoxin protein